MATGYEKGRDILGAGKIVYPRIDLLDSAYISDAIWFDANCVHYKKSQDYIWNLLYKIPIIKRTCSGRKKAWLVIGVKL